MMSRGRRGKNVTGHTFQIVGTHNEGQAEVMSLEGGSFELVYYSRRSPHLQLHRLTSKSLVALRGFRRNRADRHVLDQAIQPGDDQHVSCPKALEHLGKLRAVATSSHDGCGLSSSGHPALL